MNLTTLSNFKKWSNFKEKWNHKTSLIFGIIGQCFMLKTQWNLYVISFFKLFHHILLTQF